MVCEVCGLPIDPATYPRHPSHDLPNDGLAPNVDPKGAPS